MDDLISLAIHIGKLEARIDALEKQLDGGKPVPVRLDMGEHEPEEEEDEGKYDKRIRDGIASIMGYEYPVQREVRE